MKQILFILLLLLIGCEEEDTTQPNIDEEYSILGNWTADESAEICDYIDEECINCENTFGETEPSDLNIIEQSFIFSVSETSFNYDWCYSYDDFDEEWCNEKDNYSDFNCIWDELNNFSTTCMSWAIEVLSIEKNELCIQDIVEEECFDFSITNSGNDIVLTSITSGEQCYTLVATRN